MNTNYVLVDYENIQPAESDVTLLKEGPFKLKFFLGPKQANIPAALVAALLPFGNNVEFVCLKSSGSNALDFLIAFHIGNLSRQEPAASFHIISKDKGFDPVAKHLRQNGLTVLRRERIADIPYLKSRAATRA